MAFETFKTNTKTNFNFGLHYSLYYYYIPIELRNIVQKYCVNNISNETIRNAVKLWCNNETLCIINYGHISFWSTNNVTYISRMFVGCLSFNQPLNNWNVSNVTNMNSMFSYCLKFNQPLNNWSTGSYKSY